MTDMTLADTVAFELHEAWRRPRLQADGTYEPRWKKIKDEVFVENIKKADKMPIYVRVNEAGEYEIDIANACYFQLSEDWKGENKAAAEVVAKMVESGKDYTDAEAGDIIHKAWLERNSWAKDGELGVPFTELPVDEQEKDLVQYRIAKTMSEATECDRLGFGIEDAAEILRQEKAAGKNTYMTNANGVMMYSMFDTEETCYLKVAGKTKAEHKKAMEEWRREYEEREAKARTEAQSNIEVWYERGKKVIYPEKWDKWHKCVEARASDLYHGADLVNALDIMEALRYGEPMEKVTAIFEKANHSGASAAMVLRVVTNFSDRGPEFYRANCGHEIDAQTEDVLQKIEAENANLAKMQIVKAQNPETIIPKV